MERGRRLDLAFQDAIRPFPVRERRWVQEVSYGTVRLRGRLDHLLALHLTGNPQGLPPRVRQLLRVGAYQLLYMGGVPTYAAVSETVDQARSVARGGFAPLVNGVLRSLARDGGGADRFPSSKEDPLAHLTTWGSHPSWLVERWLARWGPEATHAVVEANNQVPALHLRPIGLSVEEAMARLGLESPQGEGEAEADTASDSSPFAGAEALPQWGCIRLPSNTDPGAVLALVPGIIQDPAASRVSHLVEPVGKGPVLDLCAAPGGKGLPLAAQGAYVVAADLSPVRLRLTRQNRDRLGLHVGLVAADAGQPPFLPAPVVILDAPCSGTGTFSRHPDARWRLSQGSLSAMTAVQDRLLDGAARVVAPGGRLLYTTCSMEPEENWERVEAFLARWGIFEMESDSGGMEGPLELLPGDGGTDGAFGTLMRRKA